MGDSGTQMNGGDTENRMNAARQNGDGAGNLGVKSESESEGDRLGNRTRLEDPGRKVRRPRGVAQDPRGGTRRL